MLTTAISVPRSRNTATRCSWCCTPSRARPRRSKSARSTYSPERITCCRCATIRNAGSPKGAHAANARRDAVIDRYCPVVDALEDELERVEEKIVAGSSPRANTEALYALKQKLMSLQHAVRPLLDGAAKLYGGRVPAVCVGTQEYYRDIYDHLFRINQTIERLRAMVTTP